MRSTVALCIDQLTIRYGRHVAVQNLALQVRPGEIYGLLGPNGSGKSSTLSAIAGMLDPSEGAIHVASFCRSSNPGDYRRNLGIVPQELALYEELNVWENLSFFGSLYGLRGKQLRREVEKVLDFIQLTEQAKQPIRTLSGGMQRRANLGCALLHRPTLLLLDEPTVGLDLDSRQVIFENLRQLREQGCAMVFTTHHLEEAEQLCDRIGVMVRGQLVAEGSLEQLSEQLPREVRASRVMTPNSSRLEDVLAGLAYAA